RNGSARAGVDASDPGSEAGGASQRAHLPDRREAGVVFDCIVAGSSYARPADLLGSERMARLLEALEQTYDVVVIDSCPLLAAADTLELLPHAASVALCLRVSRTTRDQARAAKAAVNRFGDLRLGLVLTGVRLDREYGGYGYAPTPAAGRSR